MIRCEGTAVFRRRGESHLCCCFVLGCWFVSGGCYNRGYGDRRQCHRGGWLMRRSFKFQLRPTRRQTDALTAMLADHCALYNAALQERRDGYRHPSKSRVRYGSQSAQLSGIREFDEMNDPCGGQSRWSFSSQQATLRRLNRSFDAFFARVKRGEKPGYPRFRSRRRFDTVDFPVDGDGCRWDSAVKTRHGRATITSSWTHVYLQGVGHIKVNVHRPVTGRIKTLSVTREGARWFIVLSCDDIPVQPLPPADSCVGIDLATGTNGLAWTFDGEQLHNPRAFAAIEKKLTAVQQRADRRKPKPGKRATAGYRRLQQRIAALHAKAARIRRDNHHKTALRLVRGNDVIAHEDIPTKQMTKRAKPKPDPDNPGQFLSNNQAAKSGLNKSILDAGWSQFLEILTAKAECAGRTMVAVNPAYTSQTCHRCESVDAGARNGKVYTCTNLDCRWTGDADINAAENVLRAGLVQLTAEQPAA